MVIEGVDYRITSGVNNHFWDLELLYTIKPKGSPERQEFKDAGYGMLLSTCMHRIIMHRMTSTKDVYTLKEFVDEYNNHVDKLEELLKGM